MVIANIDIGHSDDGSAALVDLEELLATRLLVQGNSGSGKSHLLRRILERSAGLVQQIVIDPEGDFVSLAEAFSHIAVEAADHSLPEIASIAARIRARSSSNSQRMRSKLLGLPTSIALAIVCRDAAGS